MSLADSAQEATQDVGLDAGLNEVDAKKMPVSSNDIGKLPLTLTDLGLINDCLAAKSTQDSGLADSDAKTKMPAPEIKKTTYFDDTSGFMAAARVCLQEFDVKRTGITSNKIGKPTFLHL